MRRKNNNEKKLECNFNVFDFNDRFAACGWKPEVTAVPLTAPWNAMNLPVKENAVVWKSEPNEFRAVHKDDKKSGDEKLYRRAQSAGLGADRFQRSRRPLLR